MPVPPVPSLSQVDTAARTLGSPLNNPVTGSSIVPVVIGGQRPPSLKTLQASRPGFNPSQGLTGPRGEALHEAALSFGARGGLAARGFALNEIPAPLRDPAGCRLRLPLACRRGRLRPDTDAAADRHRGADGVRVRRRRPSRPRKPAACTRSPGRRSCPPRRRTGAATSSAPGPIPPHRRTICALAPRRSVEYWNKWVAEGWAKGERQAVEIFLSDLGRLDVGTSSAWRATAYFCAPA